MTAPDGKTPRVSDEHLVNLLANPTWRAEEMQNALLDLRDLRVQLAQTAAQLARCREELFAARQAALKEGIASYAAIAERDAAIRDAERYRWVRDRDNQECGVIVYHSPHATDGEELDAAIDAARQSYGAATDGEKP